jgi:hypothetical protein
MLSLTNDHMRGAAASACWSAAVQQFVGAPLGAVDKVALTATKASWRRTTLTPPSGSPTKSPCSWPACSVAMPSPARRSTA